MQTERSAQVLAVGFDRFVHLHRQFARRREDQRAHRVARRRGRVAGMAHQLVQQRQDEAGGLAGAGLGAAHDVVTGQDDGNGLRLDRGGIGIAGISTALRISGASPRSVNFKLNSGSRCAPDVFPIAGESAPAQAGQLKLLGAANRPETAPNRQDARAFYDKRPQSRGKPATKPQFRSFCRRWRVRAGGARWRCGRRRPSSPVSLPVFPWLRRDAPRRLFSWYRGAAAVGAAAGAGAMTSMLFSRM